MAALTNGCLIFHFLNSRFCRDGCRKLKDSKVEGFGGQTWKMGNYWRHPQILSGHVPSVWVFLVWQDCKSSSCSPSFIRQCLFKVCLCYLVTHSQTNATLLPQMKMSCVGLPILCKMRIFFWLLTLFLRGDWDQAPWLKTMSRTRQ